MDAANHGRMPLPAPTSRTMSPGRTTELIARRKASVRTRSRIIVRSTSNSAYIGPGQEAARAAPRDRRRSSPAPLGDAPAPQHDHRRAHHRSPAKRKPCRPVVGAMCRTARPPSPSPRSRSDTVSGAARPTRRGGHGSVAKEKLGLARRCGIRPTRASVPRSARSVEGATDRRVSPFQCAS